MDPLVELDQAYEEALSDLEKQAAEENREAPALNDFQKSLGPNEHGVSDYTTDYEFAEGGFFCLQGKTNDDFVVLNRSQVAKLRQRCDEFLHLTAPGKPNAP